MSDDVLDVTGSGHDACRRLMSQQKISAGSIYLRGQDPPTPQQVSAVLHALADHTLLMHMNSETVLTMGDDRAHHGPQWRAASAHGRFLQRMGDGLDCWDDATPARAAMKPTTTDPT